PILDRAGNVWCSHSTYDRARSEQGLADGFVYRVRPDGRAEVMASGFTFANGLALDSDESYLYVCQTMGRNVVRLPIRVDGSLAPPKRPECRPYWVGGIPRHAKSVSVTSVIFTAPRLRGSPGRARRAAARAAGAAAARRRT